MTSPLEAVCADGWALWEQFEAAARDDTFHPFIPADYDVVRRALEQHAAPTQRFLEWGSATGVITVMAALLGFEAYGIELDAALVRMARELSARHQSRAQFVVGSYVPTGYRWRGGGDRGDVPDTTGEGPSGYLQLGRALDDFDVVFGYPWSGEADMMMDLMQRYGRPSALLLLNDTTDGVRAYRNGRLVVEGVRPTSR